MDLSEEQFDPNAPAINADTLDHHCFGCGNQNPIGLMLRFRPLDDRSVWADFTPTRDHEGYLGMTHGGILATILDEAMSWAITHAGNLGVTARMSIAFRRPARLDETIRVVASVERQRGRAIDTRAEIRVRDSGALLADSEGRFVRVSRSQALAWREGYGLDGDSSAFSQAAQRNSAASTDST